MKEQGINIWHSLLAMWLFNVMVREEIRWYIGLVFANSNASTSKSLCHGAFRGAIFHNQD